jgi:S-formylglutathione hydrolase
MAGGLETLSERRCFGGVQGFYRHDAAATGGPMRFGVFVPEAAARAPRPALYYLAGLTCTEETFAMKAGAQRAAAALGLVLVTSDTSPRAPRYPGDDASEDFGLGAGFYVDATEDPWRHAYRMDTYVTRELPAVVEASFPVLPEARGLFGHSMGGHGALALALRNPGRYRSVSAFAPIVAPSQVPWGRKAFTGYLGPNQASWAAYDACALVRARPLPIPLLVDVGTADKFLDVQLKPELFEAACAEAGQLLLRRQLRRRPPGPPRAGADDLAGSAAAGAVVAPLVAK